jgi:hypothetical protein
VLREHGALQIVLPSLLQSERDQLDKLLAKHAEVVDRQLVPEVLRWIDTEKYDKERVCKLLFRFYKVFRAYQSKKAGWSLARCQEVWKRMQNIFALGDRGTSPGLGVFLVLLERRRGDIRIS